MQFGAGLCLVYVTFWSDLVSMVWGSIEFLELHCILLSLVLSLLAEGFSRFYHWLGRFLVLCFINLFFVLSIMFLISCADVLGMVYSLSVVVIVVCGSSSVWLLRLLLLIMRGVNVLQRWLENSSACSSLLLAHVLSAFLSAGTSIIGFLIFFRGFP